MPPAAQGRHGQGAGRRAPDTGRTVSVVIPCFNSGAFLEAAIDSVLVQSHTDVEIIVVDDGSDEPGTLDVLGRLRDRTLRVVCQPNRGLASARNRGVSEAEGRYVQFLDADDLIEPTKLDSQVRMLEADPETDVVICDYLFTNDDGTERRGHPGSRTQMQEPPLEDLLFQWERRLSIPIHCALFRASVLAPTVPFLDELRSKEDWVFWTSLALAGRRFAYQREPLVLYRRHAGAMCNDTADMLLAMADAALYLSDRIPAELRDRFRRETIEHLRSNYVARIHDPSLGSPLRHRMADRVYAALRRIPFMEQLTRRAKRVVVGRT